MSTFDKKINVLVVEDSPAAQMLIIHILNADPRLNVIGRAAGGKEALTFLKRTVPDVIVMDIHMPEMDGYETTRRIMETQPVPIVICSASLNPEEVAKTMKAIEAGALAIVAKPVGIGHDEFEAMASTLVNTVVMMSEVRVVRRWPRASTINERIVPDSIKTLIPPALTLKDTASPVKIVAVGASTGGPPALQLLLAGLPRSIPVPVLIVQHIVPGFLKGLAEWLGPSADFPVGIPGHGEIALPGHAYLAPDGFHMGVTSDGRIALSKTDPENGLRPATSHLFRTVAAAYGAQSIGILLTGMGKDGAAELLELRDAGAITFAQDAESSVVHGMPGEAIRLEAACYVLAPERIASAVSALISGKPSQRPEALRQARALKYE